jgi:hemolysin activation/secretion protein
MLGQALLKGKLLVVIAGLALNGVTAAQQPPGAGSILEQLRPREPIPLRPPDAPVLPPVEPSKPGVEPTPKASITIKGFRFSGNTVFSSEQLREQVRQYTDTTIDLSGLYEAADRVQRFYRERGYFLALAYVPQQQVRDGVVEIALLEGRLGSVILQSEANMRLRDTFARRILHAHLKPGDLITEHALERPLLLLRDLPDVHLSSELGPSRVEVGAADLTVNLSEKRRWVSGYVDLDNHGNRFTGEYRVGVNLNSGNFTGYGDVLGFRGFLSNGHMALGRLSYSIPVGPYGTRVGTSYTAFSYQLGEEFQALDADGEGHVVTVYGLHPLIRTRSRSLFLHAGFERKNLEDRINSVSSVEERHIDAGKLGVAGDFHDGLLSGGLNSYSVTYTRGELDLMPPSLQIIDASPGIGPQTAGTFSKWNLDMRRLQRITDHLNLLLTYSGQIANKNLTAAEKMSLGGPNGVRAYPVGEAAGDSGHLFSAELRYVFPPLSFGGKPSVSAFVDHGKVKILERPPAADPTGRNNHRSISGYGLGVSMGFDGNFLVQLNIATPGDDETPQSDPKDRDPRLWIQALKFF